MAMVLFSYLSRYWAPQRTDIRTTDRHVTTKIFEIDGLPNFLRYGAPLARLRRAGTPLKLKQFSLSIVPSVIHLL